MGNIRERNGGAEGRYKGRDGRSERGWRETLRIGEGEGRGKGQRNGGKHKRMGERDGGRGKVLEPEEVRKKKEIWGEKERRKWKGKEYRKGGDM
jgi:hypothetical protein